MFYYVYDYQSIQGYSLSLPQNMALFYSFFVYAISFFATVLFTKITSAPIFKLLALLYYLINFVAKLEAIHDQMSILTIKQYVDHCKVKQDNVVNL
jgi:hypothetical protein